MQQTDNNNIRCTLKKTGILARWLEVVTPEGQFDVIYRGFGQGHEEVIVNGKRAAYKMTVFWFAPKFEFKIGSLPATLEVRVWIYLKIKSLKLTINNQVVYSEGEQ